MPLNIPEDSSTVISRSKNDVQSAAPQSNPFLRNSWLSAIITSCANRIYDFYLNLTFAVRQTFWDTSDGDFLARQAGWFGVTQLEETQGFCNLVFAGTAGTPVAISTEASDGVATYTTDIAGTITNKNESVASINVSAGVATVTMAADHTLASNVPVAIAGATETLLNGTKSITVTGTDTFTYSTTAPDGPAAGTITADYNSASISATSTGAGSDFALDGDARLTISQTVAGINSEIRVDINGTTGASAEETPEDFRNRFLFRVQNPVANFNESAIINKCREVTGVTRVFVRPITPDVGQVTVYFMRDNDSNPIPGGAEITEVKDKLLEIKPATTSDDDVIFPTLTAVVTPFTFTALAPNTLSMQSAINNQLALFFATQTEESVNVDIDIIRAAIASTVDPDTGDRVTSFDISAPAGDIVVNTGEIATLGTVTYP